MSPSATNIQVKQGGTWRTVTSIQAKDGGTWRTVQEVWQQSLPNSPGVWALSWINSDPQTYTYDASASQTFRGSDAQRSSSYLYQGYYSGTYGEHKSLILFDYADIQSKLATRPVIDAVTVRMSSDHWFSGDYTNPIGTVRIGGVTQSSIPSTWDGTEVFSYAHADGINDAWVGGYGGARDQTNVMSAGLGMGDEFRDGNIRGISLQAHSTTQYYYGYFWNHAASASLVPQLKITADYS